MASVDLTLAIASPGGERHAMRHAVLLAIGNYADEKADFGAQEGPRAEFCEIANLVHADIHSYASAVYFVRNNFGIGRRYCTLGYDRIYATAENTARLHPDERGRCSSLHRTRV